MISCQLKGRDDMTSNVVSVGLPVGEVLSIKKKHLEPSVLTGNEKRICIVTGIYGDELEGQYVCYELIRRIQERMDLLAGIVDVYPAMNPLGIESIQRKIPTFDIDLNRNFPGNEQGDLVEHTAARLVQDIIGADLCIDLHASNVFIREIPQVRMVDGVDPALVEYAKMLNVDFVWIHKSKTVLEATLVHTLNTLGVPSVAIEMGVGTRITKEFGEQIVEGIFHVLSELGIWKGEVKKTKKPIISTDGEVKLIHAETSGIFIPRVEHWIGIRKGDVVGEIIDPCEGKVLELITAPIDGTVFSLREYPIVYEGSLIARVLGGVL